MHQCPDSLDSVEILVRDDTGAFSWTLRAKIAIYLGHKIKSTSYIIYL